MQFVIVLDVLLLLAMIGGSIEATAGFIVITGFLVVWILWENVGSIGSGSSSTSSSGTRYPKGCDDVTKRIIDDVNKRYEEMKNKKEG